MRSCRLSMTFFPNRAIMPSSFFSYFTFRRADSKASPTSRNSLARRAATESPTACASLNWQMTKILSRTHSTGTDDSFDKEAWLRVYRPEAWASRWSWRRERAASQASWRSRDWGQCFGGGSCRWRGPQTVSTFRCPSRTCRMCSLLFSRWSPLSSIILLKTLPPCPHLKCNLLHAAPNRWYSGRFLMTVFCGWSF